MAEVAIRFDDSAAYERCIGRWSRAVAPTFLAWLRIPAGSAWLDVGCGTGVLAESVLQSCAPRSVHAVDASAEQVAAAQRGPAAAHVQFEVGDAQRLRFGDAAFDVVVSALLINFVPARADALAEMRRVTRTGGTVAGYVWDFPGELSPSGPLRRAMRRLGLAVPDVPGTQASGLEALQALFEAAGLNALQLRTIDVCLAYADFQDFWDAQTPGYAPTTQLIAALTAAERSRLKRLLQESLPAGPGGRIEYCARANAIQALR